MKKFVLSALILLFMLPGFSQKSRVKVHSTKDDSTSCGKFVSSYRTFFKEKLYEDAYPTWVVAFNNCKDSSEMMYVDGAIMYRSFIETATDEEIREGRIDTLMLIYDRRMKYFRGEGNILGRKGKDLLTYRRTDIEQVEQAYSMLRESIELEGNESRETVLLSFISAGVQLYTVEKFDDNQLIEDYSLVIAILDQMKGSSFRVERARTTIERVIREKGILSCEALDSYFGPQLEENINNTDFLERVISTYESAGCDRSDFYITALENLYGTESGPESAHDLALLFIASDDLQKAADYLKIAVQGEQTDSETRAEWYYELALVSYANKTYCEAIDFAREAIELKKDFGKAYVLLGDVFIASREELGDELHRRAAFWAAADMYAKADSVDPSVAVEANQKLRETATQYPSQEDVFFLDLKDGDPFRVEGCINANTTVRSRN